MEYELDRTVKSCVYAENKFMRMEFAVYMGGIVGIFESHYAIILICIWNMSWEMDMKIFMCG